MDKIEDLYIIGAGSVGGHIATNFKSYNLPYKLVGFLDDDERKISTMFCEYPVIDKIESILHKGPAAVVLGIAFPKIKEKIMHRIKRNNDLVFPTLISPNAWISEAVNIGEGCIIYPGCSINYGTHIGDFVILNMNCAIGHDCYLGTYSSFAPGVALGGNTKVEYGAELGIGSSVKQFIKIGKYAIVGGQSMVVTDVKPGKTVKGVPSR